MTDPTAPHVMEEKPTPLWRKLIGFVLLIAVVLGIVFGWHRVLSDAWPPDRSFVGPNLVASIVQWAVIFLVAVLIWPPTRRRMHRFVDRKLAPVHAHLKAAAEDRKALHSKIDANHAEHQASMTALHQKIDAAQPKVVFRARTPNFSDQIAEAMKSSKKKVVKKTVKKAPKKTAAKKTAKKAAKKTAPRKRAATKK